MLFFREPFRAGGATGSLTDGEKKCGDRSEDEDEASRNGKQSEIRIFCEHAALSLGVNDEVAEQLRRDYYRMPARAAEKCREKP